MQPHHVISSNTKLQRRLLLLAALFLGIYALALTLSPAVHARSWGVDYSWGHWVGFSLWLVVFYLAHYQSARLLPGRDPYLLPVTALLSGWGMLTIWSLLPVFGLRQSFWILVAVGVYIAGLRLPSNLDFLRRYKYLWLAGSLLLTALTLVLGVNPMGYGPRMWLGCCGVYLQPSEPLKLMLAVYLAAYLADQRSLLLLSQDAVQPETKSLPKSARSGFRMPFLPLIAPTLMMTGLALVLLFIQRDLGTAFVFFFIYAVIVYVTSGHKRVLGTALLGLVVAGVAGYFLFDVVRVRIDSWINPWLDPSGRSYQIIQALIAIANGGIIGRGPGVGYPGLVPVAHSDLIYAVIAEEHGLFGAVGLLLLIALLAQRGLRAAINAPDSYRRYLAVGLTAYLMGQSMLIIAGSLRLLPLTGVTLPFVSYGGSSLATSFLSLLILSHISSQTRDSPVALSRTYIELLAFFFVGLLLATLATGWWAVCRAPDLLARTDNPRRAIADQYERRGAILDRQEVSINSTFGPPGEYRRKALYPDLSNVVGYTSPVYGQSGLEASLDNFLRGLEGGSEGKVFWRRLLYGGHPPGLNVRLSLDLEIQEVVDGLLAGQHGAAVLINAQSGEILVMSSHPTFDANDLDDRWDSLVTDPHSPLLNRVTQGMYPSGAALGPLLLAEATTRGLVPALPPKSAFLDNSEIPDCAVPPTAHNWGAYISSGCSAASAALAQTLGWETIWELYRSLGLYIPPELRLPASSSPEPNLPGSSLSGDDIGEGSERAKWGSDLMVSPLQMVLAMATISAQGVRPAPHIAIYVERLQEGGWTDLPPLSMPVDVYPDAVAEWTAEALGGSDVPVWHTLAVTTSEDGQSNAWYFGGAANEWSGAPLVVAVLLEGDDIQRAIDIGETTLQAAVER